jgi:hypothetical protein
MAKRRNTDARLSFATANTLCSTFVHAGDEIFNYARELEDAQFTAFIPYLRFVEDFCENEEEVRIHRQCLAETAKLVLGRPWPMALVATRHDSKQMYSSEFLQRLLQRRDELNGVPEQQIDDRYPGEGWRREVDPARRRMIEAQVRDRDGFRRRIDAVLER